MRKNEKLKVLAVAAAMLSTGGVVLAQDSKLSQFTKQEPPCGITLSIIEQREEPVIARGMPGTEHNKYGFEGGGVLKLEGVYHLFSSEMVDDPVHDKMMLAHWTSPDGLAWTRRDTMYESSGSGDPKDIRSALWAPMPPKDVPPELGLTQYRFETPKEKPQEPRTTPDNPASCWKKPGPAAGPFQARLGDGSVVTYYWYRFADQPAMLNADLTPEEREVVQKRVEMLHRAWTKDRNYLAPPEVGTLASLDPALILTPPRGMEAGYVPIATRQELGGAASRPRDR